MPKGEKREMTCLIYFVTKEQYLILASHLCTHKEQAKMMRCCTMRKNETFRSFCFGVIQESTYYLASLLNQKKCGAYNIIIASSRFIEMRTLLSNSSN